MDVDLVVDLWLEPHVWGSSVDDNIWPDVGEECLHSRNIGDVSVMVRNVGASIAVRCRSQVENLNLRLGMALDDEAHNVAAQKSAAAYYDDFSQRRGVFMVRHVVWRVLSGWG